MAEKITSENHAKKQQERAMEILREVRQWVWTETNKWLPADSNAPVTRHQAESHAAYATWATTLTDAMHMIDPGYDEKPGTR